ncbi:MAG: hypothetical protein ACWIPH_08155, partial [Ostreibacterium sp.]
GANDVEGVAYKTVIYESSSSSGTNPSGTNPSANACTTAGTTTTSRSSARSYSMSFNLYDATQPLSDNGTIDANSDGKITQEDQVLASVTGGGVIPVTTVSGLLDITGIGFNPVSLTSHSHSQSNANNTDSCQGGPSRLTLASNARSAGVSSTKVCLNSFTGSWKQLK